jgi:AcrR family transcriptional regulator
MSHRCSAVKVVFPAVTVAAVRVNVDRVTGIRQGAGRPRLSSVLRQAGSARDQILDAAAEMFVTQGYHAASTRRIAEVVGVKQASLYYHFSSKQDILAALLAGTVKPSLSFATRLARSGEPPNVQLYALTYFDVSLLCRGKWNIGALYSLPELRAPEFEEFARDRRALQRAFARRVAAGVKAGIFRVGSLETSSALLFALDESVITLRANGVRIDNTLPAIVAAGALRLLECRDEDVATAEVEAKRLLALAPEIRA